MKNIVLLAAVLGIFTLCAGEKIVRPVMRVKKVENFSHKQGIHSKVWKKVKGYPMILNAAIPQDFGVLPEEQGLVKLLKDREYLYIRAELADSEVLSEAVDSTSPLMNCADTFLVVLRPLCDTGFFYIICTPNAIVSAHYVRGAGSIRLASANLPLKTVIPVYTAVKGRINDGKRDQGWMALVVLPLEQMVAEVRALGISISPDTSWSLLAGRKNFSRFLNMVELSGYPQPVRGFLTMPLHALLLWDR